MALMREFKNNFEKNKYVKNLLSYIEDAMKKGVNLSDENIERLLVVAAYCMNSLKEKEREI